MTDTYSPVLHRIDQAIRWRAVHPTEPIPPPYEVLIRYSKIPDALEVGSEAQLAELISVAELKKGSGPLVYTFRVAHAVIINPDVSQSYRLRAVLTRSSSAQNSG